MHEPLVGLALIVVLGTGAQWVAWALRLPSILLLLLLGFLAGPGSVLLGLSSPLIDPDGLFGPLLLPIVSLSVALILFEGGLSLDLRELRGAGGLVRNLVTVGAAATWMLAAAAAHWLIGLDGTLAVLLGAILVVTGPTVIQPLLRHVRPSGRVGPVLKWEGIVIDPIGALLAVLVFEVITGAGMEHAGKQVVAAVATTIFLSAGIGVLAALLLMLVLRRYWVPDYLQATVALMLVAGSFAAADALQPESGLMAVTAMGITLANQRRVDIHAIIEFKEHLRTLLLSALFVLLSARLQLADLHRIGPETLLFIVALILVVRPVSVLLAAAGTSLQWTERLFVMWMAPRGIVAAAVASVFALAMEEKGYAQARLLVPITFAVIVGTVLIYGLTAARVARLLKLSDADPQGVLIVGASRLARTVATALSELGLRAVLVDTNRDHVKIARLSGLEAHHGSILATQLLDEIDLSRIGRLLAFTSSDEVNALAVRRFTRFFGRAEVYQLAPETGPGGRERIEEQLRGRCLFSEDAGYVRLEAMITWGALVKATKLTEVFDFKAFSALYGKDMVPFFVLTDAGMLKVFSADQKLEPKSGQIIVALVPAERPNELVDTSAVAAVAGEA